MPKTPLACLLALVLLGAFGAGAASAADWIADTSGTTSTIRSVSTNQAGSRRFAVGDDATILYSQEADTTWTAMTVPSTVASTTALRGVAGRIAVGDGGTILQHSLCVGGSCSLSGTWTDVSASSTGARWTSRDLYGAAALSSNAIAVGASGTILTSADGGTTWGVRLRSSGGTWTPYDLYGVAMASPNIHYAVGAAGTVIRTVNGGANWGGVALSPATSRPFYAASHAPGTTYGWAVGAGGTLYRTVDSGATWTSRAIAGVGQDFYGVAAVSDQVAYVVGVGGTIYTTVDGGASWSDSSLSGVLALRAVAAVSGPKAWVGGDAGTILATTSAPCQGTAPTTTDYWKPYFTVDPATGWDSASSSSTWTTVRTNLFTGAAAANWHKSAGFLIREDPTVAGGIKIVMLYPTPPTTPTPSGTPVIDDLSRAYSDDGGTDWHESGVVATGVGSDVAVVHLTDGRYRVLYTSSPDPKNAASDETIRSLVSCDGETFLPEPGIRYSPGTVDDNNAGVPHVVHDPAVGWRLYFVGDKTGAYGASRGLTTNNVRSATSSDQGWTWTRETWTASVPSGVIDPAVVYLSGGGYRVYYRQSPNPAISVTTTDIRSADGTTGVDFNFAGYRPVLSSPQAADPVLVGDARSSGSGTVRLIYMIEGSTPNQLEEANP